MGPFSTISGFRLGYPIVFESLDVFFRLRLRGSVLRVLRVLVLGRSLRVKGFGLGFPNVQGFGLSSTSYL